MEVKLWTDFSKRKNSTKQPQQSEYVTRQVTLKDDCSTMNPIFFLADTTIYSYLQWGDAYYFIDDVTLGINNSQYLTCSIDVLATWKNQILASSSFVKYSSSDYSNLLHDERVAMLTDIEIKIDDSETSLFTTRPSYVLSVVGESGVQCVIPSDPNIIQALLYQNTASDLVSALCIQWSDAQSCLLELLEIPIPVGADYTTDVYVGKINMGSRPCKAQYFNGTLDELTTVIHIPESYKDFRLFSFCSLYLYLPMVGVVELDLQDFAPDPTELNRQVIIHAAANVLTGHVSYSIKNKEGCIINTFTGSFGRKLPINASSPRDVISAITHLASSATKLTAGNPADAIADIVRSMADNVHFKGSVIGSFGGGFGEYLGTNYILALAEHRSRIEPSNLTELRGRPCAKVTQLSNLTGYVETVGFSIDIASTQKIRELINESMDSGVYLE